MVHLDLETDFFNEPNRGVVGNILDLGKMLGIKAYMLYSA